MFKNHFCYWCQRIAIFLLFKCFGFPNDQVPCILYKYTDIDPFFKEFSADKLKKKLHYFVKKFIYEMLTQE